MSDTNENHAGQKEDGPPLCDAPMATVPSLPENNEELSHVEPDDIGVGLLTVVGALCAVVLLLIVVLLQAWFYNWKDSLTAQRSGPVDAQSAPAALTDRQLKRIESYGWVDAKKSVRAIPIGRAMELIVEEYGKKGDSAK